MKSEEKSKKKQKNKEGQKEQCTRELAKAIFQHNYKKWLLVLYILYQKEKPMHEGVGLGLGVMQTAASEWERKSEECGQEQAKDNSAASPANITNVH